MTASAQLQIQPGMVICRRGGTLTHADDKIPCGVGIIVVATTNRLADFYSTIHGPATTLLAEITAEDFEILSSQAPDHELRHARLQVALFRPPGRLLNIRRGDQIRRQDRVFTTADDHKAPMDQLLVVDKLTWLPGIVWYTTPDTPNLRNFPRSYLTDHYFEVVK